MNLTASKIGRLNSDSQILCFYLGPHGKVGYHQAVMPQLFLVVQGDGWVRNDRSGQIPVAAGRAVYWNKDEWHEVGTSDGLMAVVIESEDLSPSDSLPVVING